jgi:hypothetical protein
MLYKRFQMSDERWPYAMLGALLMLLGFSFSATHEYVNGFACLMAGTGIVANALRSLLKEKRPPYKLWRLVFLWSLIVLVCIFLSWRAVLRHS